MQLIVLDIGAIIGKVGIVVIAGLDLSTRL
jgi:hypothetical protein